MSRNEWFKQLIADLRAVRQARGISQNELGDKIGCTETLVGKWEMGRRSPTAFMLQCWCDALGVELRVEKKEPQ